MEGSFLQEMKQKKEIKIKVRHFELK